MPITKATASSIAPAAKGDLVVGSATNDAAVLGVGSNDQVLTADSSTATGLKWAAAGGGSYTLLSTTTLSNRQTDLTNISQNYQDLVMIIAAANWPTTNTNIQVRPNNSTTDSSFTSLAYNGSSNFAEGLRLNTFYHFRNGNQSASDSDNIVRYTFYNYSATNMFKPTFWTGLGKSDNGGRRAFFGGGAYESNSAITSITLYLEQNLTYNSGTVYLYGVK